MEQEKITISFVLYLHFSRSRLIGGQGVSALGGNSVLALLAMEGLSSLLASFLGCCCPCHSGKAISGQLYFEALQ